LKCFFRKKKAKGEREGGVEKERERERKSVYGAIICLNKNN